MRKSELQSVFRDYKKLLLILLPIPLAIAVVIAILLCKNSQKFKPLIELTPIESEL